MLVLYACIDCQGYNCVLIETYIYMRNISMHTRILYYIYICAYTALDIEILIPFLAIPRPCCMYSVAFKNTRSRGDLTGASPEAGIEAALEAATAQDGVPFTKLRIRENALV
jgi:hypothetical protein